MKRRGRRREAGFVFSWKRAWFPMIDPCARTGLPRPLADRLRPLEATARRSATQLPFVHGAYSRRNLMLDAVESAAVETHRLTLTGIPPIVPANQTGKATGQPQTREAIDQPHDGLVMIRGDYRSCHAAQRPSDA